MKNNRYLQLLLCVLAIPSLAIAGMQPLYTVTSTEDSGTGSLREAVNKSNNYAFAGNTRPLIAFELLDVNQPIALTSDIMVTQPVEIDGYVQPKENAKQNIPGGTSNKSNNPISISGKGKLIIQSPNVGIKGIIQKEKAL